MACVISLNPHSNPGLKELITFSTGRQRLSSGSLIPRPELLATLRNTHLPRGLVRSSLAAQIIPVHTLVLILNEYGHHMPFPGVRSGLFPSLGSFCVGSSGFLKEGGVKDSTCGRWKEREELGGHRSYLSSLTEPVCLGGSYLDEVSTAGECAAEYLALYQKLIASAHWKVYLAARGVLPYVGNLITKVPPAAQESPFPRSTSELFL